MKILISSLKFGVGHVAHLRAYMQLVKSCGYEAAAFVNGRYIEFLDRTRNKSNCLARMLRLFIIQDLKILIS